MILLKLSNSTRNLPLQKKRTQLFTKLQAQPFRKPSPTLEPLCKGEHACVQLILSPTSYANLLHGVQFTPVKGGENVQPLSLNQNPRNGAQSTRTRGPRLLRDWHFGIASHELLDITSSFSHSSSDSPRTWADCSKKFSKSRWRETPIRLSGIHGVLISWAQYGHGSRWCNTTL